MDDNLASRIAQTITRYSMLAAGASIGVAVSGGADSVVLLHLLHRFSGQFGIDLRVLHVNHGLRGQESEDDETFVRGLAKSLGREFLTERAPVPSGNLEEEARNLRQAFFQRCLKRHDLDKIAVGHTRSDQAETVLFRLLRGSGLAGLAGMRPVTDDGLIRPLLTCSRAEVRQWAKDEGLEWREDASNCDLKFARNRLRNEAIPLLTRHFNANLEAVLAGTAELAQDEEAYWAQLIEPLYQQITERTHLGSILQTHVLNGQLVAVQRRIVRRAIADLRGGLRAIDKDHIDAILAICTSRHGHDRVMVPGVDALRSFDKLLLRNSGEIEADTRHYQIDLTLNKPCHLPFGAGIIHVKRVTPGELICVSFKEANGLAAELTSLNGLLGDGTGNLGPLSVRNWQPGDQFQRVNHRQPEKVKAMFQEGRVLLWERRHWPVVVAGNEIVWVRQFGPAARFAASAENPGSIELTYCKSSG